MLKRALDIVIALVVLLVGAPVWLALAALIKATTKGPALHRATRVGRGGVDFTLYKFRTMTVGADDEIGVTRHGDPRVTSAGRFLRRTKLDEIPQLLNVLKGDMSLVGPRPEDPRYVADYTPEQRRILTVRPGVTSPASIAYRHEEQVLAAADGDVRHIYRMTVLPHKLALDLDYLDHRSLWLDVRILVRTLASLFQRVSRS